MIFWPLINYLILITKEFSIILNKYIIKYLYYFDMY